MHSIYYIPLVLLVAVISGHAKTTVLEKNITNAMASHNGTCVFIDCSSGKSFISDSSRASEPLTPCSTFKIWNTLIGLECKIISRADEPFYTWDGETRFIPEWNKDLTLQEAFRVSCVPAFQNLAVKIGKETMQRWIDTISYGNRDLSSGIDIFWLPREGKNSILISAEEQASLVYKLLTQNLPFSEKSLTILKQVMMVKQTSQGTLYGKTGTGTGINGTSDFNIGWFVGFIENSGVTYTFACVIKGDKVMGKDAREIVSLILTNSSML